MVELSNKNDLQSVSGGILWVTLGRVVLAAVATTDASMHAKEGFQSGFNETKAKLREQNGW
uniref:hypothetical protein n=1 Tax=Ningiella ruwaisensis TaxID=2364274 RepID=UPI00109EE798|nr:hypothetical protein [Ningiella ruwaisensis]